MSKQNFCWTNAFTGLHVFSFFIILLRSRQTEYRCSALKGLNLFKNKLLQLFKSFFLFLLTIIMSVEKKIKTYYHHDEGEHDLFFPWLMQMFLYNM